MCHVDKILRKYNASHNKYDTSDTSADDYKTFMKKWGRWVRKGWKGFELDNVPKVWYSIIDEFLEYLVDIDPTAEIHEIKVRHGGLRFFVDYDPRWSTLLRFQVDKLENALYHEELDKALIA